MIVGKATGFSAVQRVVRIPFAASSEIFLPDAQNRESLGRADGQIEGVDEVGEAARTAASRSCPLRYMTD